MANIRIDNARLSFPSLFKKATFNGQETKYEATLLVPKGSPQHKKIQAHIDAFIQEKFQGKVPKGLKITCFSDGDEKDYDGYEGMMAFKGSSNKRIPVIDKQKNPVAEEDDVVYPGCFVNTIVDVWFSDHPLGGKQILGNLAAVQFAKDGEAFGSGGANLDDFDTLDDDDDDTAAF
jgi:hypothetical protein